MPQDHPSPRMSVTSQESRTKPSLVCVVELWYQMFRATAIRISEHERIHKLYQKSRDQSCTQSGQNTVFWCKNHLIFSWCPRIVHELKLFLIYKVDSSIRSGTLGICNQQDGCQLKGPKPQAAQRNADEFSWWSRPMRILMIIMVAFFRHVSISKHIKICMFGWSMTLGTSHHKLVPDFQVFLCWWILIICHQDTAKNVYVPLYIPAQTFWYVVLGKKDDHLHCIVTFCVMVYLYT